MLSRVLRRERSEESKINFIVMIIAVVAIVILSVTVKNFLSVRNIVNVLEQTSSIGFFALGLTLVLVIGGIDLSIPGVIMAGACLGGSYMMNGGNYIVAVLLMLAVGCGFGIINGLAIAKGGMIPFIVTLSTLILSRGIAAFLSASATIYGFPKAYLNTFNAKIGIVPIGIFAFIAISVVLEVFLSQTRTGRCLYMIGENKETARVSGINISKITMWIYILSGILGGIGAAFLTARLGSATATMVGDTITNDTIAACVIGGASLAGGHGKIAGTVLGMIFITLIGNCINLLGISYYIGMIIKAAIIVIVMYIDVMRAKSRR